jgi:hypothetical protein
VLSEERFARARQLESAGQPGAAADAYRALLAQHPEHPGALNNLAAILYAHGETREAQELWERAVAAHPENAIAHANLAELLARSGDTGGARRHFEQALRLNPRDAALHRRYTEFAARLGDEAAAHEHFRAAAALEPVIRWPYRGAGAPVRLLELRSVIGRDANANTAGLFDASIFATTTIYVEHWDPQQPFPPHDAIYNAISDADVAGPALRVAELFARRSSARVFNPPGRVALTGRMGNARRLATIPAVRTPRTGLVSRDMLDWSEFPVLVRAPGFHNGRYFELVESAQALDAALRRIPGQALWAMEFVDTRDAGGRFRKYRVMTIGGALYPLHLAISEHWKVHYFSAQMSARPEYREEEARFLTDMEGTLGKRATTALRGIAAALALDYGGIDFTLDAEGSLVVFEANATMAVIPPGDEPMWDYRRPAIERVRAAVSAMILGEAPL